MRWPFGPPHLTLKPSKKKHKKKTTKKNKNTKIPKKSFSVINQNFLFLGGSKNCLFWQLGAPPKHYKTGVSANFFGKKIMRHETAIFGPKKTQIQKFQLSFLFAFFLFQILWVNKSPVVTSKTHGSAERSTSRVNLVAGEELTRGPVKHGWKKARVYRTAC